MGCNYIIESVRQGGVQGAVFLSVKKKGLLIRFVFLKIGRIVDLYLRLLTYRFRVSDISADTVTGCAVIVKLVLQRVGDDAVIKEPVAGICNAFPVIFGEAIIKT